MEGNRVVYKIVNKVNGHKYVGSSMDFKDRKNDHINGINNKNHVSTILRRAIKKYGSKNFEVIRIKSFYDIPERYLRKLEEYYRVKTGADKEYSPYPVDMKMRCGKNNPNYGKKFPEHSKRMKERMKGITGEKHPMYGKKNPSVSKMMKERMKGITGEKHPNYGKTWFSLYNKETGENIITTCSLFNQLTNSSSGNNLYNLLSGCQKSVKGYLPNFCPLSCKEEYINQLSQSN